MSLSSRASNGQKGRALVGSPPRRVQGSALSHRVLGLPRALRCSRSAQASPYVRVPSRGVLQPRAGEAWEEHMEERKRQHEPYKRPHSQAGTRRNA